MLGRKIGMGVLYKVHNTCVHSLSTRPRLPLPENPHRFLPNIIFAAWEPVKLHFLFLLLLLLLPIFPNMMRGPGEIWIFQHHYLIKHVGLNGKMPTHFSSVIVWNGNNGADRVLRVGNGFTGEDMRTSVVEGIAALAKERQSKHTMTNVEFQSLSVGANWNVLKM